MHIGSPHRRALWPAATVLVLAAFVSLSSPYAAAPNFMHYKATLTRPDGSPVADTTYAIHFAVYRDETGGAPIWYEDHSIATKNGDFHVKLGSINGLADSVFADSLRYLGIAVNDDVEMAPRTLIGSVPWSLNAHYAEKVMEKSIGREQLKDKSVGTDQLDTLAVDEGRIKDKAVGRDKLIDKAVGRDQLDTLAVDMGRLADDAVTGIKIVDGSIDFADIGQNGAAAGQVMKWNGSAWSAADDEAETGSGDSDWTIAGNVLFTGGRWGIARKGNTLNGYGDSTHVNLGCESTTGAVSLDDRYVTISGGFDNSASGDFSTIGGGENNAADQYGTVGGGGGNNATNQYSTVGGGQGNSAMQSHATVGGGYGNFSSGMYSAIGGGEDNSTNGDHTYIGGGLSNSIADNEYAVICGGHQNQNDGAYAFIGCGGSDNPTMGNRAYGDYSVIGGGSANMTGLSSPEPDGRYSVVGGGLENRATADYAAILGGRENRATDIGAVVGGGFENYAYGQQSAVPGGQWNEARGDFSIAAGIGAKAAHRGSIVITACLNEMPDDSTSSGGTGQIVLRADHGMYITDSGGTAPDPTMSSRLIDTSTGAYLSLSGDWTNASDMALKENFTAIDSDEILDKVSRLPITSWNYKKEDPNVRHIGPTAQDFYRIFEIGGGDRAISTVDPAGVALAAIKALREKTVELERKTEEIEQLKEQIAELKRAVESLAARSSAGGEE
jgi:hypothetical protein